MTSPESPPARAYHHGALKEALIEATETLLAEGGVERFSLREAARRAGVSPAAPVHHFGDAAGLLTAVAVRGFESLGVRLKAADQSAGPDVGARLRAQGLAYVRFALERPGAFDLMFRTAKLNFDNGELGMAGREAFTMLARLFDPDFASDGPPAESNLPPALGAWSAVHGFARLYLDQQLPQVGPDGLEALFDAVLGPLLGGTIKRAPAT